MQVPNNSGGAGLVAVDGLPFPVTITATTAEIEMARFVLGPGMPGTSGLIRGTFLTGQTNNANAKTLRLRKDSVAGAQLVATGGAASSAVLQGGFALWANDGTVEFAQILNTWFQTSAGVLQTAPWGGGDNVIVLTGQLGVGTDSLTLRKALVEVFAF